VHVVWGLVLLFGVVIVASNGALYAWRAQLARTAGAADHRLGVVNALWAFAKECAACAAVIVLVPVGWCMPRCRGSTGQRGPVILVHGWAANRGSLWLLRRRLLRDGWGPACCLDYLSQPVDIESAARRLRDLVDGLATHDRRPITCIGHNLGGVVLRYFARRYPAPRVRRILTLGTPHCGTAVARLLGRRAGALLPGSPLLNTLNAADHVPQQFDVIAIASSFDALILPPVNARYPGAFTIEVDDVGHHALLFSAKVYRLIAENLAVPLR
jgi:triacylglycerol lipase